MLYIEPSYSTKLLDLDNTIMKDVKANYLGIDNVHLDTFNNQIEFLDLSHNYLRSLPQNFGSFLPRLKHLKLEGNQLEALPDLSSLDCLVELCIGNCLGTNKVGALPKLPSSLRRLHARGNRIKSLESNPNLEELDISLNELKSLPHLASIRTLKAAGNQIEFLHSSWFHSCPHLEVLDITMNGLRRRLEERQRLIILQDYGNPGIDHERKNLSLLELCIELTVKLQVPLPTHLV